MLQACNSFAVLQPEHFPSDVQLFATIKSSGATSQLSAQSSQVSKDSQVDVDENFETKILDSLGAELLLHKRKDP